MPTGAAARARTERARPLKQDLESQLDRATTLEQAHRAVQIDVVTRRENDCRLWVVPRALERFVPPLLDSILLRHMFDPQLKSSATAGKLILVTPSAAK